jgi:hypothetical protein
MDTALAQGSIMQRKHHRSSSVPSGNKQRSLDAQQLGAVRGGGELGIAVRIATPLAAYMSQQHNELLVTW